ncbi:hypothetical protein SFUMM280S_10808 [Streptomyces fumanus]
MRSEYTQAAIIALSASSRSPLNAPGVGRSTASARAISTSGSHRAQGGTTGSWNSGGAWESSPVARRCGLIRPLPLCPAP